MDWAKFVSYSQTMLFCIELECSKDFEMKNTKKERKARPFRTIYLQKLIVRLPKLECYLTSLRLYPHKKRKHCR